MSEISDMIYTKGLAISKARCTKCKLTKHSKLYGYKIFYLVNTFDEEFDNHEIALTTEDYNNYIGKYTGVQCLTFCLASSVNFKDARKISSEYVSQFVYVTEDIISGILEESPRNVETYILQRTLSTKIPKVRKRVEYEVTYQLYSKLYTLVNLNTQVNILNKYVDGIFSLRSKFCKDMPEIAVNIPDIAFEVDEDGYQGYSKESEETRNELIKAFGNKLIRIEIKRVAKLEEIKKISKEYSLKIESIIKDMMIDYTPEMTAENFCKIYKENFIDSGFLNMFFKKAEENEDSEFRYTHEEIGEWLGMGSANNYRGLQKIIETTLTKGREYRQASKEELLNFTRHDAASENKTKIDLRGRDKKILYLISRLGLHLLVMAAKSPKALSYQRNFAYVLDAVTKFYQSRLLKISENNGNGLKKQKAVAKRIDEVSKIKVQAVKDVKLAKENTELKKRLIELESEIEVLRKKDAENIETFIDLKKKLEASIERELMLKEKLKANKIENSKDYNLEEIRETLSGMKFTAIKKLCPVIGGIKGYGTMKSDQKDELIDILIKSMTESKEKLEKYLSVGKEL